MTMTDESTPDTEQETEPTPFSLFIAQHAKGRTHIELSQALRDLVLAVEETGKAGSLTFKLTVKKLTDNTFEFIDSITVKAPVGERPKAIWFATDDGELTRDDPHQLALIQEK